MDGNRDGREYGSGEKIADKLTNSRFLGFGSAQELCHLR
jgi:hypothetical protein